MTPSQLRLSTERQPPIAAVSALIPVGAQNGSKTASPLFQGCHAEDVVKIDVEKSVEWPATSGACGEDVENVSES